MEELENEKIAGITPYVFWQEPIQCPHNTCDSQFSSKVFQDHADDISVYPEGNRLLVVER